QHAAHHLRGDAEKMAAILPPARTPPEKAEAELVHQTGRLEADAGSLAHQVTGRHPMQLVVDERQHALERLGVAAAPGAKQRRDLALIGWGWPHRADPRRV